MNAVESDKVLNEWLNSENKCILSLKCIDFMRMKDWLNQKESHELRE